MAKGRSARDDFDRVKDALHKAKAVIRKLQKEVGFLRKELNKYDVLGFDRQLELEDNEVLDIPELPEKTVFSCIKCRSTDCKEVQAGVFVIHICNECGYRKRMKSQRLT